MGNVHDASGEFSHRRFEHKRSILIDLLPRLTVIEGDVAVVGAVPDAAAVARSRHVLFDTLTQPLDPVQRDGLT